MRQFSHWRKEEMYFLVPTVYCYLSGTMMVALYNEYL